MSTFLIIVLCILLLSVATNIFNNLWEVFQSVFLTAVALYVAFLFHRHSIDANEHIVNPIEFLKLIFKSISMVFDGQITL